MAGILGVFDFLGPAVEYKRCFGTEEVVKRPARRIEVRNMVKDEKRRVQPKKGFPF